MNIIDNGADNCVVSPEGGQFQNVTVIFEGKNNRLTIGQNVSLKRAEFRFHGDGGVVDIGNNCNLGGAFHIRQNNSRISIGNRTTFVHAYLFSLEGKEIRIGRDCMFSSGVIIRTSDEHSIVDLKSSKRINMAADVVIADRVWLGEGVTVNKGSEIAKEVIVGAKSLVSGSLREGNCVYAGVPARLIRSGVTWDRRLL